MNGQVKSIIAHAGLNIHEFFVPKYADSIRETIEFENLRTET